MPNIYLISYDLHSDISHEEVRDFIKSSFDGWWKYLSTTWLVKSQFDNADEVYSSIESIFNDKDRILVIKVSPDYQGNLPKKAWDWINKNLRE